MSTVIGPLEGIAFIVAKLQSDSALMTSVSSQVYRANAPQSAINNPPYILVSYQGGADVLSTFATRLFTNGLYQVCVYGPDSTLNAVQYPLAQLIDADLKRTSGVALGAQILACYREQPLVLSEVIAGSDQQWTRVGGLYRLEVQ